MNEVSKPLSWSMPPTKVCEKLKAKDAQICDLKYGSSLCVDYTSPRSFAHSFAKLQFRWFTLSLSDKDIDWKTVDLKKLKVKDLKKILENWGEVCKGCTEKTDFIARINELKPKFVKSEL